MAIEINGTTGVSKVQDGVIESNDLAASLVIDSDAIPTASITAAKIDAGAVTEAKLGSGAVTETKLGSGAVTEAKLGSGAVTSGKIASGAVEAAMTTQFGRRNLIINGAMQVAQRSTAEETDVGFKTVDRFRTSGSNGGGLRQQQISLTSSDTPYTLGFRNAYRHKVVTADTSSNNRFAAFISFLEAQNVANSGWDYTSSSSTVTFSFWAKSSLAGTYYIRFLTDDGSTYAYASAYTLEANTWKKVTTTFTGNSNLTVNNDNGKGLTIEFVLDYGTDLTDASFVEDTWTAYNGSIRTGDFAQSWRGTTDATFDITGVQLEVGSVATPFEHRSYGEELEACMRYYQIIQEGAGSRDNQGSVSVPGEQLIGIGYCHTSSRVMGSYRYPHPMRAIPSSTVSFSSNISVLRPNSNWSTATTVNIRATDKYARFDINGVSVTAGNACEIRIEASTGGKIEFDAEL